MRETREDQQIHGILEMQGRTDFLRLDRAVRLLLDAEPIMGCRLVHHSAYPWWEVREDPDNPEYCRLVHTDDVERSIHNFLTGPLDPFVDPLVQVRVFRGNTDILVVKTSHMIMDGGGCNEYLYLLADLYNRLKEDPGFVPPANSTGSRSLRRVSRRFSLLEKAGIIRRTFRDFKCGGMYLLDRIRTQPNGKKGRLKRPWGLPLDAGSREDRAFLVRRIPAGLVRRLKEYARTRGATLNDAMLTAFYRAIYLQFAPEPDESMSLRTIADLRRYLPEKEGGALCNLCAYIPVNLGHSPGATFEETLLRVRDRMISQKADFIGLGIFPLALVTRFLTLYLRNKLAQLEKYWIGKGFFKPVPKFSNVGEMASDRLRFDGAAVVDAYQVGTISYGQAFTVGITGFDGALTLSVGICNASRNGPIFNLLFDGMEKEIADALT